MPRTVSQKEANEMAAGELRAMADLIEAGKMTAWASAEVYAGGSYGRLQVDWTRFHKAAAGSSDGEGGR